MRPTIYDIAKAAGVSTGTVSRALSNTGYVKAETRQRIDKVVKELRYIPNRSARTLKTKKTGLLLLAVPDMDNPFYIDMVKAVHETARSNGYSPVLYYTEGKEILEIAALRLQHERLADGLFMVNFSFSQEHIKEIGRLQSPLVLSSICQSSLGGKEDDGFDYIGVDSEKGIYLATRHLIGQGHTDILYLAGVKGIEVFEERYQGYCNAMLAHGLDVKDRHILWGDYSESFSYKTIMKIIQSGLKATAICAANDMLAIGALRALEEQEVPVPGRIALIGMDNTSLSMRSKPALSTVALSQAEMGRIATELLIERISEKRCAPPQKIILEPRLVIRTSSMNAA